MKAILSKLTIFLTCLLAVGQLPAAEPVEVGDFALKGKIDGENITFELSLSIADVPRHGRVPLIIGDVAYLSGDLPRGSVLERVGDRFDLCFPKGVSSRRPQDATLTFASRALRKGEWRETSFQVPGTTIRQLAVACDKHDLDIRFPGALNTQRSKNAEGATEVTAYLGVGQSFQVQWKPQVKRLEADLVVSCDASTIAVAGVGVLRLDSAFRFNVIQGELRELVLDIPGVSVTRVTGDDIQEWQVTDATATTPAQLKVRLSRPSTADYLLRVESEKILPAFPCDAAMPVITPRDVIRDSGFLLVGTDSAIKMQIRKAAGLTQIDQEAFSGELAAAKSSIRRSMPKRRLYAYQYAKAPYVLDFTADDIVTSLDAEHYAALRLFDGELAYDVSLQLDIKDSPAHEISVEIGADDAWTVTSIQGKDVADADADVRIVDGKRIAYIPFTKPQLGTTLVQIRLERPHSDELAIEVPVLKVPLARSDRGYLVAAAEKGVQFSVKQAKELREIHTGSAPMSVEGAQIAFRFRDSAWQLTLGVEQARSAVHSEVFHLVSLGEGVLYSSVAATYHVGSAPLQSLQLRIPADIRDFEIVGAQIESWDRQGDICTIQLQTRIMGDYTLLVTYDQQSEYRGDTILPGQIETIGTESEVGYIILSSAANMQISETTNLPPWVIAISADEVPAAYSQPLSAPIAKAYKFVRNPHTIPLKIEPLPTERLLGQVVEYADLHTIIDSKGGAITRASYYLKNATEQFLLLRLPPNATVWYVHELVGQKRVGELPVQKRGEDHLIPVPRPRDPNTPIGVEITYAENLPELGLWSTGIRPTAMLAPALPSAHAAFTSWSVSLPESMAFASASGTGMTVSGLRSRGFTAAWQRIKQVVRVMDRGPVRVCRELTQSHSPRGRPGEVKLSRSIVLATGEPLAISLSIVPAWLGTGAPVRRVLLLMAGGVLLLILSIFLRRRALVALGLTLTVLGAMQSAIGETALAIGLFAIALLVVCRLAWILLRLLGRGVRRCSRRGRARRERRREAKADRAAAAAAAAAATPDDKLHANDILASVLGAETSVPVITPEVEATTSETTDPDDARSEGSCRLALLPMLLVASATMLNALASPPAATPCVVMDNVAVEMLIPADKPDVEQTAAVTLTLDFSTEEAFEQLLLPPGAVLTDYKLGSRYASMDVSSGQYCLKVARAGDYKMRFDYRMPITEGEGSRRIDIPIPANMRNRVRLRVPERDLDVQSSAAVLFRVEESETATTAEAVFGPAKQVSFEWRPRVRKTTLEKVVLFSEINSWVTLKPGVIDFTHRCECRIAQGETKALTFRIPAGMSVTAVRAENVATWRFDPETGNLEILLSKPVAGNYVVTLATQIACEGLPYKTKFGVPVLVGADRQRGAVALSAPQAVQVRVDDSVSLSPMNAADFAPAVAKAMLEATQELTARRAFRYHQPQEVSLAVHAERVLPEIRVTESASLSIADERSVLSTRLALLVSKAGVFDIDLLLPEGYELETLTGPHVSHTDEPAAASDGVRHLVVHLTRQVLGETHLNAVIARSGRGVQTSLHVPRLQVTGAAKHTGRLHVAAERGVRLAVADHHGVDVLKPEEEGIRQPGVLLFSMLRPSWGIDLTTNVLKPVIKPIVLQRVDISEGMLQCRAFVQCRIENAGVKSFRLQAPDPSVTLTVTGRNISRVSRVEGSEVLWQVDLHSKEERLFPMTVSYQMPYNNEKQSVAITPLKVVGTDDQRGYVVIMCDGRIQVQAESEQIEGLKRDSPSNVPASFGAGDLSHAVLCYRAVRADYTLPLSVVRNAAADVLPASIEQLRMATVQAADGNHLTRLTARLQVGSLRLLRVAFPGGPVSLWTVLVDGKEVATSRTDEFYGIPLDEREEGVAVNLEVIYSGAMQAAGREMKLVAPRFEGVPLKDAQWQIFVHPGSRYYGFGGTMEQLDRPYETLSNYDYSLYYRRNNEERDQALVKAQKILTQGENMAKAGNQRQAREAFEQAYNYSVGQADLNEDARVQLRNLTRQQFKLGLVDRRNAVRVLNNIMEPEGNPVDAQQKGYHGGDFSNDYAQQVEQQLGSRENTALDIVAERMIDQQAAAAGVEKAIRVMLPEHGRQFIFHRDLKIDPAAELSITFKRMDSPARGWFSIALRGLAIFAAIWGLLALFTPRRKK